MQFQVPQFIETEDKIIGPLTIKQFFFIGIPLFISFFLFMMLNTILALIITSVLVGSGAVLAFAKMNGRPMSAFVVSAIKYLWSPKVYKFRPGGAEPTAKLGQINGLGLRGLWENLRTSKAPVPQREKPLTESFGVSSRKTREDRYEVVRRATGEKEVAKRVDYR